MSARFPVSHLQSLRLSMVIMRLRLLHPTSHFLSFGKQLAEEHLSPVPVCVGFMAKVVCQPVFGHIFSLCRKLLEYLQSLFQKGFTWRTINLHRSAISGILEPSTVVPIGQHPLVCWSVKGVFNERPPPVRVVPTWDIGKVLQCVSQWHPTSGISLQKLTWKVVLLLATCTAKCVSDLLFFLVDQHLCHVGNSSILLQTAFGSKIDCPSHRVPPVRQKQCAEESLCPVSYLRECIRRTEDLSKSHLNCLFLLADHTAQ